MSTHGGTTRVKRKKNSTYKNLIEKDIVIKMLSVEVSLLSFYLVRKEIVVISLKIIIITVKSFHKSCSFKK